MIIKEGEFVKEQGLKEVVTGVDKLVSFLKGRGLVDMLDVSLELNIPLHVLQTWADFLTEEEVVGLEYKFTKPFIYLIEKSTFKMNKELSDYRRSFEINAKKKSVPNSKTEFLWKNHMLDEVEKKRQFFFQQTNLRALDEPEKLWTEYKKRIKV